MAEARRELRTWRQRIAAPAPTLLKGSGDEIPDKYPQTNSTNSQTPDSLRVGLLESAPNIPKQTPEVSAADPCVLGGCTEPIADGDLAYCIEHRQRADDGTLWGTVAVRQRLEQTGPNTWVEAAWARGLCVWCPAALAPGDVIACAEHRAAIDDMVTAALS